MLTEKTRSYILQLQKKYPEKRSALIPALHIAQAEAGYLPRDVQNEIAELFGIDPNEVNAVVTFYDMFFEEPVGKHVIHVCKNVSCMLRGADGVLEKICHRLEIKPGETTSDKQFTVIASECLGACDKAPMLLADDQVIGPVLEHDIENIIQNTLKKPGTHSPVALSEAEHA